MRGYQQARAQTSTLHFRDARSRRSEIYYIYIMYIGIRVESHSLFRRLQAMDPLPRPNHPRNDSRCQSDCILFRCAPFDFFLHMSERPMVWKQGRDGRFQLIALFALKRSRTRRQRPSFCYQMLPTYNGTVVKSRSVDENLNINL